MAYDVLAHAAQQPGASLSDHTMGIGAAVAAIALGASVVEKRFTLAPADGGVDSTFSQEPAELANLVTETNRAWQALGELRYGPTEAEQKSLVFRRSIYVAEDIAEGELFTAENLKVVRPGDGAPPKWLDFVLNRRSAYAMLDGQPLKISQLMGKNHDDLNYIDSNIK